jgi:hypothetical protein
MTLFSNTAIIQRLLWLGLLALPLSACSSLGNLGGESFTLAGELPANFFIKGQAYYYVANDCDGRADVKTFKNSYQGQAQQYNFTIPVNYRDGLCEMALSKVDLFINGRYGDKDWQQTYADGGLLIVDKLPEGAPGFQADGSLTKQAECTWWFQLSKAKSRKGEISKLLNCKGAGAYLLRDELPGKTVKLEFRMNPEEEPSHDDTWVQFPGGWKPCLGKGIDDSYGFCRGNTKDFRTFKMDDRVCTVYPNCTE